jgi:phosphopantothenoylcysteine decarboxylase / phosphopantothenate---cysteine ligase
VARILLGVTGGIAAYKAIELARLAIKAGHGVRVLMTPTAGRFVGAASFEAVSGAPVLVSEFDADPLRGAFPGDPLPAHNPIGHLEIVANADCYAIAPASANTISKLAVGLADSMVTTAFLANRSPALVAPAMNDRMYASPAVQANLRVLRERGVRVVEPEEGSLASKGEHGLGRLPEPARLLGEIESLLPRSAGPWDGLRVLVTAGGTREPIDSVRYIGNRSSGRMGLALAAAAARRGANVTLVAANVAGPPAAGVERVEVETAAQLARATHDAFESADVLLMAAAVSDFTPERPPDSKIPRASGSLDLHLQPTEDVLASLGERRGPGQLLIGFAAEHGAAGLDRAREKLTRKRIDAIVVNDISRADIGFDSAWNEVVIVDPSGEHPVPRATKEEIAEAILDRVDTLRASARTEA